MKRMIKYHSPYQSDGAQFSTISTKCEILPGLYPDSAGVKDLKARAKELGLSVSGAVKLKDDTFHSREIQITESLKLKDKITQTSWNKTEEIDQYLGFVRLVENDTLPPLETIDNTAPEDSIYSLLNGSNAYQLGIEDTGESIDGEYWLIMSGWHYFHQIPLLGYSLDKFQKVNGVDETYFYDSVERCSSCYKYDHRDDGYQYNHRAVNYECLGINCGCFKEHALNNVDQYANDASQCIEAEVAEELVESKRLKFIERFVGGMTDSWRHHSYGGETVRIGEPESILKELLAKDPKGEYVFSHDESGQFQTYFSVYKLIPKRSKKSTPKWKRSSLKAVKGA